SLAEAPGSDEEGGRLLGAGSIGRAWLSWRLTLALGWVLRVPLLARRFLRMGPQRQAFRLAPNWAVLASRPAHLPPVPLTSHRSPRLATDCVALNRSIPGESTAERVVSRRERWEVASISG